MVFAFTFHCSKSETVKKKGGGVYFINVAVQWFKDDSLPAEQTDTQPPASVLHVKRSTVNLATILYLQHPVRLLK